MAKAWSTLTDGYSNENRLTIQFINGVGWVKNGVHMNQLEAWYGYHVDRTTYEQPDLLDKATKAETTALCAQYGIDMADKPKWIIIAELRAVIGVETPIATEFVYNLELGKWLEEHI